MPWQQLKLTTDASHVDALTEKLELFGAQAISLFNDGVNALYEPGVGEMPIWEEVELVGLFAMDVNLQTMMQQLGNLDEVITMQLEQLEDCDWERKCLEDFKPLQFSDRLWIYPTGYDIKNPQAINLRLDPGLAFGTGTHPTTALCLKHLDKLDLQGKTLIDYGCGSGILAIAARLLGAEVVWAIDHDPQALIATQDNAEKNGVLNQSLKIFHSSELPMVQADIMVANILEQPLIELAPRIMAMTKDQLILSGILAEQVDEVVRAYHASFTFSEPEIMEGWALLSAARTQALDLSSNTG